MTYQEAERNQWAVAYHRIQYAKEHGKPCQCKSCKEHLEAIARGPEEEQ